MAAADDEAEVARPGRGDESRIGGPGQALDNRGRFLAALGDPAAAAGVHRQPQGREVDRAADRALVDAGQELGGQTCRSRQKLIRVHVNLPHPSEGNKDSAGLISRSGRGWARGRLGGRRVEDDRVEDRLEHGLGIGAGTRRRRG